MPNKDFLDQFSTNNVPDSFKKEELKPVKKKTNLTSVLIVVLAIVVLSLIGVLIFLIVNRPNIDMPNFVGQKVSDVTSWLKQQEIEASGIVYKEEYSDDYDEKIIIKQSIPEGEKVKKDVKMDFIVSLGPDPNTSIIVPDISSMMLDDIKEWIDDNKLRGVKLNYEFSDTDPLDSVISFVFGNNTSESNFTRSSSLTITISKGKQSDQAIAVPNFIGKNVSEVETWGSKNKIKIVKKEEYSSTVQKDVVISQSVNVGKKITSKETLTVNVSRGEAIYAPDFSNYSEANVLAWGTKNIVNIEIIKKYSANIEEGKVMEQSNKGEPVNDGMTVTISLGNISSVDFVGNTESELDNWIKEKNKNGANLSSKCIGVEGNDTVEVGNIFDLSGFSVGGTIKYKKSKGKYVYIPDDSIKIGKKEDDVRSFCSEKGLTCVFEYNSNVDNEHINEVQKIKFKETEPDSLTNYYIYQDEKIIIIIDKGTN